MNITKLNFASEIIMKDGRVFKFDDINCMNTYVNRNKIKRSDVKAIFVRDYETSEWINIGKDKVYFLRSRTKRIFTPMDSGIIIFNNKDRADSFAKENDCEYLTFDEIVRFPQ
jgi:copper chaperone NosL